MVDWTCVQAAKAATVRTGLSGCRIDGQTPKALATSKLRIIDFARLLIGCPNLFILNEYPTT